MTISSASALATQMAKILLDGRTTKKDSIWIFQTSLIVEALRRSNGRRARAAKMLGIPRKTLEDLVLELGLNPLPKSLRKSAAVQLELFPRKLPSTSVTVGFPTKSQTVHNLSESFPKVIRRDIHRRRILKAVESKRCG